MEPLIFDEKYLAGGSEPNSEQLIKSGTISLNGREDLKTLYLSFDDCQRIYNLRVDGEHNYPYMTRFGSVSASDCLGFDIWRSSPTEISYTIILDCQNYHYEGTSSIANCSFNFVAEFNSGDDIISSIPINIINDPNYKYAHERHLNPIKLYAEESCLPETVDWYFGGRENIYIPGNRSDPWRYQYGNDNGIDIQKWGVTRDNKILLRVYEDALPLDLSEETISIQPNGYGIRNDYSFNRANFYGVDCGDDVNLIYKDQKFDLPYEQDVIIDIEGGQLVVNFDRHGGSESSVSISFQLKNSVRHLDSTKIDVVNQQNFTLQVTDGKGNTATKDILVQIVDDAPFVRGEATMDMSNVAAWTLAGNKLALSYDYLKDVLYRSTDYNDWATGFKVTNCEGKYGSIGVFGDDGNPDDPATAPGAAYYMVDPDKIAFVAPGQVVTEAVQYSYTDSDGDTANGVLNIVLKGTGLNPAEAIDITPRPGNVPISGGDVPADNPYVPGNPADPDRDLTIPVAGDYDPMNPNWGLDTDGNALMRVFESGLPNGSEAGQRNVTAHGYLDIDATVGIKSLVATTDGTDSYGFEDNMMAIPLEGGTLTLTQNPGENYLKYEFILTDPVMHDPGNGINSDEQNVKLIATDNYGNVEAIGLEVQIIDDVPEPIRNSGITIRWVAPVYMWPDPQRYGNLGYQFHSADAIEGLDSHILETVQDAYGTFNLVDAMYANDESCMTSTARYTVDNEKLLFLKNDEFVTQALKYTYIDADGDVGEVNSTIELHGPGVKPHFTINETDLANGSELALQGLEIIDLVWDSKYGSISQGPDGIWRYKLSKAMDSGSIQGSNVVSISNEIFLRVKDSRGVELNMLTDVDIIDSVPTFTASQNRLAYDFGADNGPGSGLKVAVGGAETDLVPGVETIIAGQHGMLTLSADGSCNYAPNSDAAGIDRFDFTIIDSDGDRALAAVVASMVDGAPQTAISIQTADELAAAEIEAMGVPDVDSDAFFGA